MENEENRSTRGKIYSIRSHQTNDIYIGSTIDDLPKRLYGHKRDYRRFMNEKDSYVTSFEIVKYEDCYIELIENFPCNSKNELHRKEGEIIRKTECVNKLIAGRTDKEYREENKEQIALRKKEYYEKNKEQLLLKSKEYYEENKEKVALKEKEYREKNKEKVALKEKEYREKNKEKIALKAKKHYENNKEKIALKNKERREKKITSYSILSSV